MSSEKVRVVQQVPTHRKNLKLSSRPQSPRCASLSVSTSKSLLGPGLDIVIFYLITHQYDLVYKVTFSL